MSDILFEWDTWKAAANWQVHGVTFEHGQRAFSDPFAVEMIDEREDYGEERVNLSACATARCCTSPSRSEVTTSASSQPDGR